MDRYLLKKRSIQVGVGLKIILNLPELQESVEHVDTDLGL